MTQWLEIVIVPVNDLARAKKTYGTLLGSEPVQDTPYYVAYDVGGRQLGLDPNGHMRGMMGPVCFWPVSDIEKSVEQLVSVGAEVVEGVRNVGEGRRIAMVKDADGNITGLVQDS